MLTVACVCFGNKYSKKYVHILQAMVKKNLSIPHKFVCFTDDPKGYKCITKPLPKGLPGWWNKIYLFKKGLFPSKCLYLDLDIVITGNIDHLVTNDEFTIIKDWNIDGYNSSVMLLSDAFNINHVWDNFNREDIKRLWGDQDTLNEVIPNSKLFEERDILSYKSHCIEAVPKDCNMVVFHGRPNPHEFTSNWIRKYWKE